MQIRSERILWKGCCKYTGSWGNIREEEVDCEAGRWKAVLRNKTKHKDCQGQCKQGEAEVKCSPKFQVRCWNKKTYWPSEQKTGKKETGKNITINCFMKHQPPYVWSILTSFGAQVVASEKQEKGRNVQQGRVRKGVQPEGSLTCEVGGHWAQWLNRIPQQMKKTKWESVKVGQALKEIAKVWKEELDYTVD